MEEDFLKQNAEIEAAKQNMNAKSDIFFRFHGYKDKQMLPLAQRTKDGILHFFDRKI